MAGVNVVSCCQHITYSEVQRKIPSSCLPLHWSPSSLPSINRRPIGSGVSLCKEVFGEAINKRGIPITPHSDRQTASVSRFLALFVFCCEILVAVRSLWIDKVDEWTYALCHLLLQAVKRTWIFRRVQKKIYNEMDRSNRVRYMCGKNHNQRKTVAL